MTELEFIDGKLENKLKELDERLYVKFKDTVNAAKDFLGRFASNFSTYTDHSVFHSFKIIKDIEMILEEEELENLNADELYILLCASVLHDIGMCVPEEFLQEFVNTAEYRRYQESHLRADIKDYIREIHHELSYEFIIKNYEELKIINKVYAEVIALIAKAHRKTKIDNFDIYKPKKLVRTGTDFVCMPYLACVLKIVDEIDITNMRTPDLIVKYYHPNDKKGREEFEKHQKITILNRQGKILFIQGDCDSYEIYNLLTLQIEKIDSILAECQKILNKVENTGDKVYKLNLSRVENQIATIGFEPKNIGFSYDNDLIFNYFVGRNLYPDPRIAIREILQNAIDACRLRRLLDENYNPQISIQIEEHQVIFKDNGIGMNEFDVENYFSRIGNSYFNSSDVKPTFDSIGRFGLGVLSYFVLCDNFEIKTKKIHSNPLWFRVDKISKLNYLFYENVRNLDEGTEVIIPINEENRNIFVMLELHLYLEENFINLEIPISLKKQSLARDYSFDPAFTSKYYYQSDISELETKLPFRLSGTGNVKHKTLDFKENDFEGQLNLFYLPKDTKIPNLKANFHKLRKYAESINVKVFYNGFFIQNVESINLHCLGGYINIKKSMQLNLNKTQFISSKEIIEIIQKYEIKLFKLFLEEFDAPDLETKYISQKNIFQNIFRGRSFYSDSRISAYHDLFKNILINECYDDEGFHYCTLQDTLNKNTKFLLYPISESIDGVDEKEDITLLYKDYDMPIYIPSYSNLLLYLEWIYRNRFHMKILGGPLRPTLLIDTSKANLEYKKLFNKYLTFEFDFESIFANVFKSNSLFQCVLNRDHPIINFLLEGKAQLAESIRIQLEELLKQISEDSMIIENITQYSTPYSNLRNDFNELYKTSIMDNILGHEQKPK